MSLKQTVVLMFALVLPFAARPAAADPGQTKQILKDSIKIEEARAKELDGLARNDEKLVKEIGKLVKVREKFAADAEARAKSFRDAAGGVWPHNTEADQARAALESFAKTYEEFAKHDREQAEKRKEAEAILVKQAEGAEAAAKRHREHVADLKQKLALLK